MKRILIVFLLVNLIVLACAFAPAPMPAQPLASAPGATPLPAAALTLGCSDPDPPVVTDLQVHQPPSLAEPAARLPFRDPIFGRCLTRVTDRVNDKTQAGGLKNEYSRVQSFNADETRLLVMSVQGGWYLYNAQTFQPLGPLPLDIDPRWSATDPNLIYFSQETRLMSYHIATQQTNIVHEFANDFPGQNLTAVWGRYEGSPSRDGRWWGLMAEDQDWLTSALLVYDLTTDQVTARLDTRGWPADAREMDSVTISPLGNYLLVYMDRYCAPGQLGTEQNPCGLMVYDRNLQNGRGLLRIIGHSDTALDAQGNQVLVYQDIDTDHIAMLDLASGAVTPLWPLDFSHTAIGLHLSGRAFDRPGWAVISTHDGDAASHTWMDDQVFLIELEANGRVVRLAHTRSRVDENQEHDYWAEPQASANRDLTRVLFTTNWGRSGTEQVEMYQIVVPAEALAHIYYVAPTGNDANPGTQSQPWRTIQHAADTLTAGDTVYIRAGTYHERVLPQHSGSPGNAITYAAYPGETATIDGSGVTLPDDLAGLFDISNKNYIIVSGLRVINAGPYDNNAGILVNDSSYVTITHNSTCNTNSSGIGVWGGNHVVVDGNRVDEAGGGGWQECITVAGTATFEVRNNQVLNCHKEGIDAKDGASNGLITRNVVNRPRAVGIYVDAWDKPTHDITVSRNVVFDSVESAGFAIASEMGGLLTNIRLENNLAYRNHTYGIEISHCCSASHPMDTIVIINNTLYDNGVGWGGGIIADNAQAQNVVIRNNIASQNLTFQLAVAADVPAGNVSVDHNLIDGYRGYEDEVYGQDYVAGAPQFVDPAQGDFHLQPGSPAVDAGSAAGAPSVDMDGDPRPGGAGYDIGADEYAARLYLYLPLVLKWPLVHSLSCLARRAQ